MRVTIYGLGNVGSAVAFGCIREAIASADVNQIDLIDTDIKKLYGEYSDLVQATEVFHRKIEICLPIQARPSDVYVIAVGTAVPITEAKEGFYSREMLFQENIDVVMPIIKEIKQVRHENSLVLMVTNPSNMLAQQALEHIPLVFPIGSMLDNARLRLTKVEGSHEKPNIQKKYADVKKYKGYTNWACAGEVLMRISQWGRAIW